MTGSRLGRGRGGRLALYGGCLIMIILLVFLYRAAINEMTRLRELHIQCAHQQEALAAQLQVIFEYKVRLEKSLAEEKSANSMVKQELQQRATREKSLRDKDSIEAMQRFNSLQQQHKLLQSEHQDLIDECNKRQKLTLEETNRLEGTLQDLRSQIRTKNKDNQEKEKIMENFKSKYFELDSEKSKIENKYNDIIKNNTNRDNKISLLTQQVFQLEKELEEIKSSCRVTSLADSKLMMNPPYTFESKVKPSGMTWKIPSQLSVNNSTTSLQKVIIASSTVSNKTSNLTLFRDNLSTSVPIKSMSRLKLPMGVVPIPKMLNERMEKYQEKNVEKKKIMENRNNNVDNNDNDDRNKLKNAPQLQEHNIQSNSLHVQQHIDGGGVNNIFNKKDNTAWNLRVKPGFQEIGELNRDEKLSDLEEKQRLRDVEEQDDDYRDPQMSEEEQDEDDQIEDDQIK